MTTIRKALVIAAIAFAAFGVNACGATPPSSDGLTATPITATQEATTSVQAPTSVVSPAPTFAPVGTPQSQVDKINQGVATVTVLTATWSQTSGFPTNTPAAGTEYLTLDITIQGLSGNTRYNPFDWTVRDAAGKQYQFVSLPGAVTPLGMGVVTPGDLVRGNMVFELAQGPVVIASSTGLLRWMA